MFGTAIRYMVARKPKPKMKPIELKTPPEQTQTITRVIFDILKEHGPLSIADTWERVKVIKYCSYERPHCLDSHLYPLEHVALKYCEM